MRPMLKAKLLNDLKNAMKSGDSNKVAVLRLLSAAIHNKEIELHPKLGDAELGDEIILAVLNSEAKKRKESIDIFTKSGRTDLAEKEQTELSVIQSYLPEQLSREQIEKEVGQILDSNPALNNFGVAMKEVMKVLKGRADGAVITEILKKRLGN